MKAHKLAVFILSAICGFPALAMAQEEAVSFNFAGEMGADGWKKTEQVTLETSAESLRYTGSGWDAKLYRVVKLPAGAYTISGRARGVAALQIRRTWEMDDKPLVTLNLTGEDWTSETREFETGGGNLILVIHFGAAGETQGEIQSIKIEPAPESKGGGKDR